MMIEHQQTLDDMLDYYTQGKAEFWWELGEPLFQLENRLFAGSCLQLQPWMTDDVCNLESLELTEIFMLPWTALFHVYQETVRFSLRSWPSYRCVLAETLTFYKGVGQESATLIPLK